MNPLSEAHLRTILAHWDLPPITAIDALHADQQVYRVTTTGGAFTLKDITYAPDLGRLEFTRSVLEHVARAGLRVPLPIPTRQAQNTVVDGDRHYLLAEFIEAGRPPSEPERLAELAYQTGRAIAGLHLALATYADAEMVKKTWREDFSGSVGGWISDLSAGLPEAQAEVVRLIDRERGQAISAALRDLPEQLIHRDCHPGNVLVDGTRVIGFIDCDHICLGPPIFDLASYAVHLIKWDIEVETVTRRWLAELPDLLRGYQSRRTLTPAEVAALPDAMLAYHLLLAHWFLSLPQLEPIGIEIRALAWLHRNFAAIIQAIGSA